MSNGWGFGAEVTVGTVTVGEQPILEWYRFFGVGKLMGEMRACQKKNELCKFQQYFNFEFCNTRSNLVQAWIQFNPQRLYIVVLLKIVKNDNLIVSHYLLQQQYMYFEPHLSMAQTHFLKACLAEKGEIIQIYKRNRQARTSFLKVSLRIGETGPLTTQ
ncbi:Hypothetical_protein [Hexamita inflata]|uniref:Hypothetical_protein n=1 Tax=Hexamita inflata TaxID=28002 RepID=A0ABP1HP53_9EUKA